MQSFTDATCSRRRIARLFVFSASALVLTVAVLTVLFLVAPAAQGQAPWAKAAAAPPTSMSQPAQPAAQKPRPSGGGMHQGITVHGHWVIEVKDPDGTVVSQTEFENSLVTPGFLSALVTGSVTVGTWEIDLGSNTGSTPCGGVACRIVQPISLFNNKACTTPPAASNLECWLTVTVPTSGANTGDIVLTGSTIALQAGSVTVVTSDIIACTNNVSPALCDHGTGGTAGAPNAFTQATNFPGSPIEVTAAGQTITATVTISFQ